MIKIFSKLDETEKLEFTRLNNQRFLPYLRLCLLFFFLESLAQSVYVFMTAEQVALLNVFNIHTAHNLFLLALTFIPYIKNYSNYLAAFAVISSVYIYGFLQTALGIPFEYYWIAFFIPILFTPLIPSFLVAFGTAWLSLWLIFEFAKVADLPNISNAEVVQILLYYGAIVVVMCYLVLTYRVNSFLMEKELEAARIKADAASEAKSKFLATMSHEVRTPLNGILGIVEIMKDTNLSEIQQDYMETVKYSGEALLAILNDILDFSKIEAGKFQFEYIDFNIDRLAHSVVMLMRSRAEEKGLKLSYEIDPDIPKFLNSDPTRLRQVLLNFIGNAIKFTDRGSVTLLIRHITFKKDNEKYIRFEVKDTGIGLSEEARSGLFQEFVQADSSISRKYGGTGLGLAISKNITELMGGKIGVRSSEGEGSTFWFRVPYKSATKPDIDLQDEKQIKHDVAPGHILVVEDNHINQKIILGFLERFQHRVTIAQNGQDALDILNDPKNTFDVVLMDMQMPVMDGLEATKKIRALANNNKDIPIVTLSANILQEDKETCLDVGMNAFLSKPIDPNELFTTVRHFIEQGRNGASQAHTLPKAYNNLKQIETVMGRDYLNTFINDGLTEIETLINNFSNDINAEEQKVCAHNLKNFANLFGLDDIETFSRNLEISLQENDEKQSQYLMSRLTVMYDKSAVAQNIQSHYFGR